MQSIIKSLVKSKMGQKEREKEERRKQPEKEKAEREHAARMEKLKQQKANAEYWRKVIETVEAEIKECEDAQAKTIVDIKLAEGEEERLNGNYERHRTKYEEDLTAIVKKIEAAALKYAEAHGKIRDAINST
eukprot:793414_1